ncbi:MAG TPA: KpsF/GutQ family sugar-phosphate isomerase [Terriglobia bacterium]|nr:KpsF/GutQ family sugar-phosphate isomerase [Terriglobia bacterium]
MRKPSSAARPAAKFAILEEIANVIDIEIEALQNVRSELGAEFEEAVNVIAACAGQVIVTGVGKSGIIANKIAATLRSTGTPALFLHAWEALHGDIGIVGSNDVVLAIGKSGETTELNDLLRFLKKRGARIISLTSNGSSSMSRLSDITLDLHIPREACPLNLAPTASTTATLVVGDAIAVVLMKMKNISETDFARHHPGGQLGKRLLLTVEDVMRKGEDNPVIPVDRAVKEMLIQITTFRVGAISVANNRGELLGLVTDYDIRKALESDRDIFSLSISEIMNASPDVVFCDEKAVDALEKMKERKKPTAVLPVINRERRVVGMVHLHDLISLGL